MLKIVDSVNENIIMENLNNRIDSWYFALEGMYYRCGYYEFISKSDNYKDTFFIERTDIANLETEFHLFEIGRIALEDFN